MCNAFNHPPSCDCGWGPKDSLGPLPGVGFEWTRSIRSYESFVNPNAICPACNARVYFYRSPDGGRVYFDRLGPPWPKHPCMALDKSPHLKPRQISSQGFLMACPPPDGEGWRPLLPIVIKRDFEDFYLKINQSGFPGNYLVVSLPLAGCSPIYWRKPIGSSDCEIEISLLDKDRYGRIISWTDVLPTAKSLNDARFLVKTLRPKFKAR